AHAHDDVPAGGARYCIRVRAYSDEDAHHNDVISASFTQLNGANHPAFQFDDPPSVPPSPTTGALHADTNTYILPSQGSFNTRTPLLDKNSTPPTPLSPVSGATVSTQLEFHWTGVEAARNYTLQVSSDPTFSNVLDTVVTDSTAYTSSKTYPTDTQLYWRVRANDV